ncbi:hypothetical protein R0137_00180 [Congregibacter brevis]|uniref:Uncharacterized protein n=1 Tax=Congregibacter brevis TaxID=3081201 RepID=A0ABZ0IDW7_9GAMM|nr:hypothetical protein R0137_00180 [Congregibacter sp. IMCC45268]
MGIIGVLLAALIVGFLVMSNISSSPGEQTFGESQQEPDAALQLEMDKPANAIDSVQQRADSLLQSSEDKYRELDQ